MAKIKATPDLLISFSTQLCDKANEIEKTGRQLHEAVCQLDWELRQRPQIEMFVERASQLAQTLGSEATRMADFIHEKAQELEQADRQGVTEIGRVTSMFPAFNPDIPLLPDPRKEIWLEIKKIPELSPKVWSALKDERKIAILNKVEEIIANAYGFPALTVERENNKAFYIVPVNGELDSHDKGPIHIELHERVLDDSKEALDTLLHETRHAIQYLSSIKYPDHPFPGVSIAMRESWKPELENYTSPEENIFKYRGQITEIDARDFAKDGLDQIYSQ